jgi:hypothetical protein
MTTISIERLVSSFNNESMILDSTYDDIKDLFCANNISFKDCYNQLKQKYIFEGDVEQVLPSSKKDGSEKTYEDLIGAAEIKDVDKKKIREEFIVKYIKQNYFLGSLFGNNYRKVAGERKNTLFIFPSFNTNSKGVEKLNTMIEKYYRWVFSLNDFERFYLTNSKDEKAKASPPYKELRTLSQPTDGFPCNAFAFLPVFSDATSETNEEFKQRIEVAFDVIADGIKKEARYIDGQVVIGNNTKIPFTNICFMVDNDKDKNIFTGYYSGTKLSKEKSTILNDLLRNFIQRKSIDTQNIRLPDISPDPMKKFTKEYISKDFAAIARKIGISLTNDFYVSKLTQLNLLVDKINETYKKTVDKAYAKLATAQSNISFMRLYYRVNNIDKSEDNIIRTGNDFLYRLTGVVLDPDDDDTNGCNTVYICKMYEVSGRENRYRIEVHKKETKEFRLLDDSFCKSHDDGLSKVTKADDTDLEEDSSENPSKYYQTMIEVKKVFGVYRFKKVDNSQSYNYPGTLTFFRDLHTNERYKWFKHNDINGTLSQEMQIKFYQNILFDKISLIEYLKSVKKYNEKNPNIGYEFLKINEDIKLLMEYSDFIYNSPKFNKTHINEPGLLVKSLPFNQNAFLEKIKDSILDIIFQPNQIIYIGGAKKSTSDIKDTSQNYKVIGFTRYKTDIGSTVSKKIQKIGVAKARINDNTVNEVIKDLYPLIYSHLTNISHGDENEVRYCPHRKLSKCEIIREEMKPFEERIIAVIDITRDVHDASELKEKAKCKRLRKTIKLRLKRFMEPVRLDKILLGKVIGGNKRILKTKRRKRYYKHN